MSNVKRRHTMPSKASTYVILGIVYTCIAVWNVYMYMTRNQRYFWWYPSIYPFQSSQQEANTVYLAYAFRTQSDIEFFYKTDTEMYDIFYDILRPYVKDKNEIKRVLYDKWLLAMILVFKVVYNRARPYQINTNIQPPYASSTYHTPAHPAGHAAQAYYVAKVFSKKFPHLTSQLMRVARAVDETRVKAGIHYPSDGAFARRLIDTYLVP